MPTKTNKKDQSSYNTISKFWRLNNFRLLFGPRKLFYNFLFQLKFFEIQLFFSISLITLKRWNFPDNLDFKGKIVAKFLMRSHFLSIQNDMTVKQQIKHGATQKLCHLLNGTFHPHLTWSHFVSFTLSLPLCSCVLH